MPLSGKEMLKRYLKEGWIIVKKQGKGSHTKIRKGDRTQIIPMDKELSKGLEQKLLKYLEESKK